MQRLETSPKFLIPDTIPGLLKGAIKEVAQHDVRVRVGGEGHSAGGKNVAFSGHGGARRGVWAGPPGRRVVLVFCEAVPRIGGAGGFEPYPQISTQTFALSDDVGDMIICKP